MLNKFHTSPICYVTVIEGMIYHTPDILSLLLALSLGNVLTFYDHWTTGKGVFQTDMVLVYTSTLYIMSAHCIMWNRHLPYLSLLHSDSFALSSL